MLLYLTNFNPLYKLKILQNRAERPFVFFMAEFQSNPFFLSAEYITLTFTLLFVLNVIECSLFIKHRQHTHPYSALISVFVRT